MKIFRLAATLLLSVWLVMPVVAQTPSAPAQPAPRFSSRSSFSPGNWGAAYGRFRLFSSSGAKAHRSSR